MPEWPKRCLRPLSDPDSTIPPENSHRRPWHITSDTHKAPNWAPFTLNDSHVTHMCPDHPDWPTARPWLTPPHPKWQGLIHTPEFLWMTPAHPYILHNCPVEPDQSDPVNVPCPDNPAGDISQPPHTWGALRTACPQSSFPTPRCSKVPQGRTPWPHLCNHLSRQTWATWHPVGWACCWPWTQEAGWCYGRRTWASLWWASIRGTRRTCASYPTSHWLETPCTSSPSAGATSDCQPQAPRTQPPTSLP